MANYQLTNIIWNVLVVNVMVNYQLTNRFWGELDINVMKHPQTHPPVKRKLVREEFVAVQTEDLDAGVGNGADLPTQTGHVERYRGQKQQQTQQGQ